VDLRVSLEDLEKRKFFTLPGFELQPIASRYTDYAIPAPQGVSYCHILGVCMTYKTGDQIHWTSIQLVTRVHESLPSTGQSRLLTALR
jgi:hypothetical protein